jgi:ATP-dependent RNA helicase SUPV3L1/SUV3
VEVAPLDGAASEISSPDAASPETAAADTMAQESVASEPVAPEPVTAAETDGLADVVQDSPAKEEIVASSATLLPYVSYAPVPNENEVAAAEAEAEASSSGGSPDPVAPIEAPAAEAPPHVETVAEPTPESAAAGDAAPADAGAEATAPDAVAAPEMVDVWRPGGRSEERRPRHDRGHDRNRHRHQARPQEGAQPVAAVTGEAGEGAKQERHRRGRRDRNNDFRKPRTDAPTEAVAASTDGAPAREQRQGPRDDKGRPPRERFEGKGRDRDGDKSKGRFQGGRDKGGREGGGRDKRDAGPSHRQWATSAAPRERDRPIDPNSPFAKLAALKEQLTARKD